MPVGIRRLLPRTASKLRILKKSKAETCPREGDYSIPSSARSRRHRGQK
jgi:hypothetical protein